MKPYKGYLAGFYVDEDEEIIRGKVLNARDTITFYGKTVEEAWQAFSRLGRRLSRVLQGGRRRAG